MFEDVSLLFIGFDGYIDVWNHCFELLNRYWVDRPDTYLASSEAIPEYDNVCVIPAGSGSEWSLKAQTALKRIQTPYTILMLEDFFISDYIDNKKIEDIITTIRKYDIKFYQLNVQLIKSTWEKGKPFNGNKDIKVIPHDKKYGLNLQAAIWDTEFLRRTIGTENYNAWEFESRQLGVETYNTKRIEYLIDVKNPLNITHMIVQSKYLPGALRAFRKKGYHINRNERAVLSFGENFKYHLKLFMYSATPKFLVEPFKAIGRLMKVDFVTDRINGKMKN